MTQVRLSFVKKVNRSSWHSVSLMYDHKGAHMENISMSDKFLTQRFTKMLSSASSQPFLLDHRVISSWQGILTF